MNKKYVGIIWTLLWVLPLVSLAWGDPIQENSKGTVPLRLRDVIQITLKNNVSIAVQEYFSMIR